MGKAKGGDEMDEPTIDWRGILLLFGLVALIIWLAPTPKKGDTIPLTPPESLYHPHGTVQKVGD